MVANMMHTLFKFLSTLLSLMLSSVLASALDLNDPTRPYGSVDGATETGNIPLYAHAKGLQSVMVSPENCMAIIDGKTVVLGAKHGIETLVEVTERGVTLQGLHGRRSLTLYPAVGIRMRDAQAAEKKEMKCRLGVTNSAENPVIPTGQKEKK